MGGYPKSFGYPHCSRPLSQTQRAARSVDRSDSIDSSIWLVRHSLIAHLAPTRSRKTPNPTAYIVRSVAQCARRIYPLYCDVFPPAVATVLIRVSSAGHEKPLEGLATPYSIQLSYWRAYSLTGKQTTHGVSLSLPIYLHPKIKLIHGFNAMLSG